LLGVSWGRLPFRSVAYALGRNIFHRHCSACGWTAFAGGDELRDALLEIIRFAHIRQVKHWISNQENMHALRPSGREWIKVSFLSRFRLLAVETFAIVVSGNIHTQVSTHNVLQSFLGNNISIVHYFDDLATTLRWIEQGAKSYEQTPVAE